MVQIAVTPGVPPRRANPASSLANLRCPAHKVVRGGMQSIYASCEYTYEDCEYMYGACEYTFASCVYSLRTRQCRFVCGRFAVGLPSGAVCTQHQLPRHRGKGGGASPCRRTSTARALHYLFIRQAASRQSEQAPLLSICTIFVSRRHEAARHSRDVSKLSTWLCSRLALSLHHEATQNQ